MGKTPLPRTFSGAEILRSSNRHSFSRRQLINAPPSETSGSSPVAIRNMQTKQLEDTLVNALHSSQLRTVLAELQEDSDALSNDAQTKLRDVIETVETIDASTIQELSRIKDLLEVNGVSVLLADVSKSEKILHWFMIEVEKKSVEEAARLLDEDGYFTPLRNSHSYWRRYTKFYDRANFSCDKQLPFRVQLSWQPSFSISGKLARLFRPSVDDLKCVELPDFLWPVYSFVKFSRRIFKTSHVKDVQNLGPFLGTPTGMIQPLLKFAGLQSDHELVDIGCGDGRILLEAANEFGCRAIGYETDKELLQLAESNLQKQKCGDLVTLRSVDGKEADVSNSDVVFVFLPANVIDEIVTKLLTKMKPGAVLIAHEQCELKTVEPTERMPLILPCGISVAYKWLVRKTRDS